ncbi:MAG: LysE family transporter, partial [candidate division WOR-3 bacterium]
FFNPYFLIWWLGIGTPLIYEAIKKSGFIGLSVLYIFHVSLDYFWLIFIATLSSFAKKKIYRYLLFILGIIIIYFGIKMLFILF